MWRIHRQAHYLYKSMHNVFKRVKEWRMQRFKERYYGNMLNRRVKIHMQKYGRDIKERNLIRLRHVINVMSMISWGIHYKKMHIILKDFLERKDEVRVITNKFVSYYENVSVMQLKMKIILKRKIGRFSIISDLWDQEIQMFFLGKCLSNKNSKYFKKFKKLSLEVGFIKKDIKDSIIK